MQLSPNAFAWVGVALALVCIGSQFSEFRSNWLTIAFGVAAVFCLLPAIAEWTGWTPMNINEAKIRIIIVGVIGFVLFAGGAWVYQRNSEISEMVGKAVISETEPQATVPAQPTATPGIDFREVPAEQLGIPKEFMLEYGTNKTIVPYEQLKRQGTI